jgi:hypothetical protein
MSLDTKFIQDYRENFNTDVLFIVNILNKIFNIPKSVKNYIEVGDQIPQPLRSDLSYDSLKNNPVDLEKEIFLRVCQNIASVYTSHINPPTQINLTDLPLQGKDETTNKPVGVMVGDLTEYVYNKNSRKIEKKEKTGVQEEICNTDQINELKKYFFLKLKLLVYLRSVLNLNNDENLSNQWETIFLNAVQNNYNPDKIENAGNDLKNWYEYIKRIFNDVKNDQINIEQLNQYISAFEKEDPVTRNLCESIIQICDPTATPKSQIQKICSPQINIHSVTTDICNREEKGLLDQSKFLDQKILEEVSKRKDTENIQKIWNDLQQQQKNSPSIENMKNINQNKKLLLDQLLTLHEKNPGPPKRAVTLSDLKPTGIRKTSAVTGPVTGPSLPPVTAPVTGPSLAPVTGPIATESSANTGTPRATVCLGRNTLLEELNGLILTIEDDRDRKLLEEIKQDYINLVGSKISKIKNKYISS